MPVCRDSDGASPNAADISDDDDHTLRRRRDVTVLAMTSRPTTTGPQGATNYRNLTADDAKPVKTKSVGVSLYSCDAAVP